MLSHAKDIDLLETVKEEPFGTTALAESVVEILEANTFIIMKNHGFISLGKDIETAARQATAVQESISQISKD